MSETVISAPASSWSSRVPHRSVALARLRGRRLELVFATFLYLGFACYLTWPLVTNLSSSLYGGPGDPYGTIAFFRTVVAHHYDPFLPGTIHQFGAPTGIPIPWSRDLASAPETLTLYLLTVLFGAIGMYGVYTLAGYTLTGVATFLLARRLTANAWAALIAGWAYAFYPFAAINGQDHVDYVHGWLFVLAVWRMVELMWDPTRRNGLLAGMAVALCMWWSPYFILFGGVTYAVVTAVALLRAWRGGTLRQALGPQLAAAIVVLVFMAAVGALASAGGGEAAGVRTHTAAELSAYSARPAEYLLPDVQSPLLGHVTRPYLARYPQEGSGNENTLYLGITVLLLALVAVVAAARHRVARRLGGVVLALALLAAVAAITSMPPEARILGVAIVLPLHFIADVTTTWRVYSRFVIVVMLAVTLLATVGLDVLTRGRGRWVRIGLMTLATVAIPLDLWDPQSGVTAEIAVPGIYRTLARQPAGAVAEYPFANPYYTDIFFQGVFNKPMLNGYQAYSFQERAALAVNQLDDPATAGRLATLGVRYVLVDAEPPSWNWPLTGRPGRGFRMITHEPYADLYLVTARPSPALAAAGEGFGENEVFKGVGGVAILEHASGTIDLVGRCTACDGVLSMMLLGHERHEVRILNGRGRVLSSGAFTGSATATIRLQFSRHTSVRLVVTPAPRPTEDLGSIQRKDIGVTDLEFTELRGISRHAPAGSRQAERR